jgi:hypothetical protein
MALEAHVNVCVHISYSGWTRNMQRGILTVVQVYLERAVTKVLTNEESSNSVASASC